MTPYSGDQAREKIVEQVDKVKRSREEMPTNGSTYTTVPSAYERS